MKDGDVISVLNATECWIFQYKAVFVIQNDLPPIVNDHFHVGRRLGIGTYGEVFSVRHYKTYERFAIKVVQNKFDENCTTENEANLLKHLNHPAILKMYHIEKFSKVSIIWLEYMGGGSLSDRIQQVDSINEDVMKFLFYQILHGVKYLHDNNITHRDLKPDNILLSSFDDYPKVKLSDFGLSKLTSNKNVLRTFVGTIAYLAPEVLLGNGEEKYTEKVDTWSLGVILYLCLTGDFPYDEEQVQDIGIFRKCFTETCLDISEGGRELINRMLNFEVDKRPSVDHMLLDIWFNDNIVFLARKTLAIQQNRNTSDAQSEIDFKHIFK